MSATFLQDALVIILNVAILGAAGLAVQAEELRAFAKAKRTLWIAIGFNLCVLPAFAWVTSTALDLPAPVTLGIVLAAAAPGGGTGLLLTQLAGGNLSYAVAMVFLFLLAGTLAVPVVVSIVHPQDSGLLAAMIGNAIAFQLIPFGVGIAVQRFRPVWAKRWEKPLNRLGLAALVVLTLGLFVTKGVLILSNGAAALVVMALCSFIGYATGFLIRGSMRDRAAVAFSTGVRNLSLGILLAGLLFPDPATMMAVLSYGLLMYLWGFPAVFVYRALIAGEQKDRRESVSEGA